MLLLVGFPLMFLELSFGQYASLGPIAIFERFCPLLQGESFHSVTPEVLTAGWVVSFCDTRGADCRVGSFIL